TCTWDFLFDLRRRASENGAAARRVARPTDVVRTVNFQSLHAAGIARHFPQIELTSALAMFFINHRYRKCVRTSRNIETEFHGVLNRQRRAVEHHFKTGTTTPYHAALLVAAAEYRQVGRDFKFVLTIHREVMLHQHAAASPKRQTFDVR